MSSTSEGQVLSNILDTCITVSAKPAPTKGLIYHP